MGLRQERVKGINFQDVDNLIKCRFDTFALDLTNITGSEIVLSWSPMRLKILHWRPEFHNWSPTGD